MDDGLTVNLLPEDVPGALLDESLSIEDHSVAALQRWLECRGYKRTGTKAELVIRILNCIQNGQDKNIFIGVDNGRWYDIKRNLSQTAQTSTKNVVYVDTGNLKWGRFPSQNIPKYFNKGHIYTYIVGEKVDTDDPELEVTEKSITTTVKPFKRGSQYVDSDHITEVFDSVQSNLYIAKCLIQASFKKNVQYNVVIWLNKISGAVIKGTCQCKQSSLGKCSHVAAFLLFLSKYIDECGNAPIASTSKPRQWGIGAKDRNPGVAASSKYTIKRYKISERATFDPRPKNYERMPDYNNLVRDLQASETNTMLETLFGIEYEDFEYTQQEIEVIISQSQMYLRNLSKLLDTFSSDHIFEIPGTKQQSETWLQWRTNFITSSNVKIVCSLKSNEAKKNFLLKNLWRCTPPVLTAAMMYGKQKESAARSTYENNYLMGNKVVELGLVVNKNYPYCASSVDGIILVNGELTKIIEIKCPKILENCKDLNSFDTYLSPKQKNNIFLSKINNEIKIKDKHPYLYQILTSLLIFDIDVCDLVVWCPNDILVLEINRDNYLDIITEIKTKVSHFYQNVYIPEIFCMRCVRNLIPIEVK